MWFYVSWGELLLIRWRMLWAAKEIRALSLLNWLIGIGIAGFRLPSPFSQIELGGHGELRDAIP